MQKKQFKKSEVTRLQKWQWILEDMTGLCIHKIIATLSRDQEIKKLYREMEKAVQKGNQPKAVRISEEIKSKVMLNTQERIQK